jgi:hypothetical protein
MLGSGRITWHQAKRRYKCGGTFIGPSRGTFHQTAGAHNVSGNLAIAGFFAPTYGRYLLDGGTLVVGGSEAIGHYFDPVYGVYDRGDVVHSGGTNIAHTSVVLGPRGSYVLSGGSLKTPLLDIFDGGSFTWSNGDLDIGSLNLAGRMTVAAGSGRTMFADVHIDNSTGKFDLTDNNLIVDYPGDTPDGPVNELRQDLRDGALFTSVGGPTHALGYADNSVLELPSIWGRTFPMGDFTQLLVKYTFVGDADLNGDVDVADLGALASHWQSAGYWSDGDFDYNGTIDVNDLGLRASNWQAGTNTMGPSFGAAVAAVGLPSASVPEPSAGVMLGLGACVTLARRVRSLRNR